MLTDYFRPEPGGLEAVFSCIANQWQTNKIEVIVPIQKKNCLSSTKQRREFCTQQKYPIHYPELDRAPLSFISKYKLVTDLFLHRLNNFGTEHVLFSDISLLNSMLARQVRKKKLPYSFVLHGANVYQLNLFFTRGFIEKASTIFTLSLYLRRSAIKAGISAEKICVLPPGMKPRWEKSTSTHLPQWLKRRIHKKTLLLSVGPLVARKGLEKGIEAVSLLTERHPNIHYVIVGSGPEFPYLKEHAKAMQMENYVTLTGFVNDELLGKLFRKASVLLQPGTTRKDDIESLGITFMEAAWFGVPVVAGKQGGIEEVIINGRTGFLTKVEDSIDTAMHTNCILSSPSLNHSLGENAQALARKYFHAHHIYDTIRKHI